MFTSFLLLLFHRCWACALPPSCSPAHYCLMTVEYSGVVPSVSWVLNISEYFSFSWTVLLWAPFHLQLCTDLTIAVVWIPGVLGSRDCALLVFDHIVCEMVCTSPPPLCCPLTPSLELCVFWLGSFFFLYKRSLLISSMSSCLLPENP